MRRGLALAATLLLGGCPEGAPTAGLIVRFRPSVPLEAMRASLAPWTAQARFLRDANRKQGRRGPELFDRLAVLRLPSGVDPAAAISALRLDPAVEAVEPDLPVRPLGVPDDPRYPEQWGPQKIQAPAAWDVTTGRPEVVVAVLDTGVDYTHPDLGANLWVNEGEVPANGADDDGNGFVDDVRGYDFVNEDSDPMDSGDHGTHVAGIIGAVGNNQTGVAGVCWTVRIMPVKVTQQNSTVSSCLAGIQYAVVNGAHILNNSWGFYADNLRDQLSSLEAAVDAANEAGCLFVAASGSNLEIYRPTLENPYPRPMYPAGFAGAVAVTNTTQVDLRWPFSVWGPHIDLCAPGFEILSTIPGGYFSYTGTSQACPFVSGLAALLKSRNPALSREEILDILIRSADDVGIPGWDPEHGHGRINAARAMALTPSP